MKIAIGDKVLIRSSAGQHKNGEVVKVKAYDSEGNPLDHLNRPILSRHISAAYSRTSHAAQGETFNEVYFGVSMDAVQFASQKIPYVAATRGKVKIKIFVDNKESLSQIEARTGDRTDSMEMFNPNTLPDELKKKIDQIDAPSEKVSPKALIKYCMDLQQHLKNRIKQTLRIQRKVDPVDLHDRRWNIDLNQDIGISI